MPATQPTGPRAGDATDGHRPAAAPREGTAASAQHLRRVLLLALAFLTAALLTTVLVTGGPARAAGSAPEPRPAAGTSSPAAPGPGRHPRAPAVQPRDRGAVSLADATWQARAVEVVAAGVLPVVACLAHRLLAQRTRRRGRPSGESPRAVRPALPRRGACRERGASPQPPTGRSAGSGQSCAGPGAGPDGEAGPDGTSGPPRSDRAGR